MADVVNLNKARKQKVRTERKKQAETNRTLHGRTKSEKTLAKKRNDKQNASLDGKKLDN